jgi:hypothetical protein
MVGRVGDVEEGVEPGAVAVVVLPEQGAAVDDELVIEGTCNDLTVRVAENAIQ